MKMQLQSLLISDASNQREPSKLNARYATIRQDLLDWRTSWQMDFMPGITNESHAWTRAAQYLEAWGTLQYNASIFMLSKQLSETIETSYEAVKQVICCCSLLARQHQFFFSALSDERMTCHFPVFPVDWTVSHLLFAAAIQLLSPEVRSHAERKDWERVFRSSLVTMALLEADPANLCMGFSEILEKLYDSYHDSS